MARQKIDGVVEAVHFAPDGKIAWVRAYERRGSTFSDRVLLDRENLVKRIKAGKQFFTGKRIPLEAGTFEIIHPIRVTGLDDHPILVTGFSPANKDTLDGVPVI
jgi:hypothetical protein